MNDNPYHVLKGALSIMSSTKDSNKKAKDNNAINMQKNQLAEKNRQAGKFQYSKKTDHL